MNEIDELLQEISSKYDDLEREKDNLQEEVDDLESEINSLKDNKRLHPIFDYIKELDKDLHIYLNPSKRTLEQVCYDLMQLIKE